MPGVPGKRTALSTPNKELVAAGIDMLFSKPGKAARRVLATKLFTGGSTKTTNKNGLFSEERPSCLDHVALATVQQIIPRTFERILQTHEVRDGHANLAFLII